MQVKLCDMLREKRIEKNLTKKKVAEMMGVTSMYYARYENNGLLPSKNKIDFFASFLEISKDDLLSIIEKERNRVM